MDECVMLCGAEIKNTRPVAAQHQRDQRSEQKKTDPDPATFGHSVQLTIWMRY